VHVSARDAAGCGLGAAGFLLLSLFHGAAINLPVFAYALLALLLALLVVGPARIAAALTVTGLEFAFVLAWLGALAVSYTFSLSKDGSFVPTLVLAVPVMAFVLGRGLGYQARVLFSLASVIVFGFACWSAFNLLLRGDLARFSLTDQNNYGTLMYLILIPWIHRYLAGWWQQQPLSVGYRIAGLVGMFIVFVTLFGTSSRACLLVVAAAFMVWFALALRHRLSLLPVFACAGVAAAAYLAGAVAVDLSAADRLTAESVGTGFRVRAALLIAAFDMLDGHLLTGIGVLAFPLLYRTHRTVDDLGTTGLFVHNDYVQFLVEGGLPLVILALLFVVVAVRRCIRSLYASGDEPGFADLGMHLGVCAAAFHALINFVYYTPALGFMIGVMVALQSSPREPTADAPMNDDQAVSRLGFGAVVTALLFGWSCWLFLAVDTLAAGVFAGQRAVPFASTYRRDPDRMLEFARTTQALNGNRGLPVLVEASLLARKAAAAADSDPLVTQTLAAYRRAIEVDPYNGAAWLGMAQLVEAHPRLQARLPAQQMPEALVLAGLAIDPLFVPSIDWLVLRYSQSGREAEAYAWLRRQILPSLRFLGTENPEAAVRYFRYLEATAKRSQDTEVLNALQRLRSGQA